MTRGTRPEPCLDPGGTARSNRTAPGEQPHPRAGALDLKRRRVLRANTFFGLLPQSTSALGAIEKPPPIARRGRLTPQFFGVSGWRSRVMGRGNERHTTCAARRVNAIMNLRLTPPRGIRTLRSPRRPRGAAVALASRPTPPLPFCSRFLHAA
jgi:hypothetical protein